MLDHMSANRSRASALPWRCFPAARRQLQHLRPTSDPSVAFFATKYFTCTAPASLSGECTRVLVAKKHIGFADREILVLDYEYNDFQNPPCVAFRQMLIARIPIDGTSFSPLPCWAWHGYMVTIAHRVEVEVGAHGPASAPPPGPPPVRRRRWAPS
jgi:hypothetical protein